MNIDNHYYTIKVLVRRAGFSPEESELIAYASQYVDDATLHKRMTLVNSENLIKYKRFENGVFDPICSAHSGVEMAEALGEKTQKKVYVSFHFIPEKEGKLNPETKEIEYSSYLTKEDGELANKLLNIAIEEYKEAVKSEEKVQKLIKIGIALHSYADTYSHQGFSGIENSDDNDIGNIKVNGNRINLLKTLGLNILPDIGHLEAWHYPDNSHIKWSYEYANEALHKNDKINRDNCEIFLRGFKKIYKLLSEIKGIYSEDNWNALRPELEKCLKTKDGKRAVYSKQFPDISFNYDKDKWFNEALSIVPVTANEDFYNRKYKCLKDMKWFYFHYEAYEQRKFIIGEI